MRKGFTLIELLIALVIIAILSMCLWGLLYNLFAEPITRVGVVVDREHVVTNDDEGFDDHNYYVTVQYLDQTRYERHWVSEKIYTQMIPQQQYKITMKGTWVTEVILER